MEKAIITVEGMSCEHCVNAITKAVSALPGIESVLVDLEGGKVMVEYDSEKTALNRIESEIDDQGFEVIESQTHSC